MSAYTFSIPRAYEATVRRGPDKRFLVFENGATVTHRQFNELANRYANVLRELGVRRRDVIGIVHEKILEDYCLMLGALKIGAAYVNIDDRNPPARLKHIFATAKPALIFGREIGAEVLEAGIASGAKCVVLDSVFRESVLSLPSTLPTAEVHGNDPAYIMYTSGSTGVPKGALISHAAVVNFAAWIGERFNVHADDTLTNLNPMYFDNSVFDFYGALLNGAGLAPVGRDTLQDPPRVIRAVEAAECSLWFSVPSLLIYLRTMRVLKPDSLQTVDRFVFGGEGYPKGELAKLHALYGERSRLINVYGPTECTCMCSAWDVLPRDLESADGLVTLGPIADNFEMLVLDGDRPVSPGEVGELCLLGPQVGLGYANDETRTAAAFVRNPLNDSWNEKMYRTGDLVKTDLDGRMLNFVGRKDNQIKHMGYRIELEEIESAINQSPGVSQSCVLLRKARRDTTMLVAYVAGDDVADEHVLRGHVTRLLPPYMVPQRFVVRERLPKNANGKVDRIALVAELDAEEVV